MRNSAPVRAFLIAVVAVLFPLNSAAGGKSPVPGIPAQFQGRWASSQKACKLDQVNGDWTKVTSSEVIFYEDSCSLRKVGASNQNNFSGNFDCAGEGQKWKSQASLRLDNGKLLIKIQGMSGLRSHMTRCR